MRAGTSQERGQRRRVEEFKWPRSGLAARAPCFHGPATGRVVVSEAFRLGLFQEEQTRCTM